jgi:CelD/BcsL family acetyltransferase involved in cellulose biosynthesis
MIGFFGGSLCSLANEFLLLIKLDKHGRQERPKEMPSDTKLTISVYESLESLDHLRPEWNMLLAEYAHSTTFSTYEWLAPWWRAFGSEDRLLVLAFRDASSTALVGLAPMAVTTRGSFPFQLRLLRLMGDGSNDSDNLDLPVKPGFERRFAESLFQFLRDQRHKWDFGEFNTLPPQSAGASAFREFLGLNTWVAIEKQSPASAITLPATWEEYLQQQLSAKERGKISYYSKRLEKKYHVRFYRCESESQLPVCLEALFELHQKRWQSAGQPGSFDSVARRQFYLDFGRLLLARDRLELWLLDLNGKPAAAQFGFRFGDTVSQLQEGFDRVYSTDSVGYVLRARVIQELIARGVRTYDFLGGEPGYKAKWGAQAGYYLNLRFARPYTMGAAYLQAQDCAVSAKLWLRRNLPAPAWELLHKINVGIRRTGGKTDTVLHATEEETVQPPGQ